MTKVDNQTIEKAQGHRVKKITQAKSNKKRQCKLKVIAKKKSKTD